jgi:hypothetical protein
MEMDIVHIIDIFIGFMETIKGILTLMANGILINRCVIVRMAT